MTHRTKNYLKTTVDSVAPKQPACLSSPIWELYCLLINQCNPILQIRGQCGSQIRLCVYAGWSGAALSAYVWKPFLARPITYGLGLRVSFGVVNSQGIENHHNIWSFSFPVGTKGRPSRVSERNNCFITSNRTTYVKYSSSLFTDNQ